MGDILDRNGTFYTFDTLKEIYGVRVFFLNYESKKKGKYQESIQSSTTLEHFTQNTKSVENIINTNRVLIYQNRYYITCNVFVAYLLKDNKESRRFYDILAHVDNMDVTNRWRNQFGNISDKEWKSIKDIKEVKLADFQYKINNNILVTNSFLFKIKKINNNRCSYCNDHRETIEHLLLNCTKVKSK